MSAPIPPAVVEAYAVQEQCAYCDAGQCEGAPEPTPQGPYYPHYTCPACNGDGWIMVEYEPVTEDDLEAFYDA